MSNRIHFQPNQPQTLSLVDPAGEYDFDLQVGRYQTTDGRELQLPRPAVIALNQIEPAPGEEVTICLYRRGNAVNWTVALSPQSEKARAAAEEEPSELAQTLKASIDKARNGNAGKRPVTPIRRKSVGKADDQPRLFDRGTGTDGPAPRPLVIPAASAPSRRDRPAPIPWNVAFREVSAWVSKELAANSLQWSDQAQQAMVCTVCIAEAKAGRIALWERKEE